MRVREATPTDAPGIARVHVDSWRSTYRGLLPDHVLAELSYEQRELFWARVLGDANGDTYVYVAEDADGAIVGFANGGPSRTADLPYAGELYAIYLRDTHQRVGLGRRLMRAVVERLGQAGLRSLLVWVMAKNESGCRFYAALGGRQVSVQPFTISGVTLDEVGYGWADIGEIGAGSPKEKEDQPDA